MPIGGNAKKTGGGKTKTKKKKNGTKKHIP